MRRMETTPLTITDAARRFNVSRATLLRRVKAGTLIRNNDGTFDVNVLLNAGYVQRDSGVSDTPHDASQDEPLKGVIDLLKKQLEASQDEKAQLLKQLDQAQALLLNEQQNIQRLLTAGQPQRPGLRDRLRRFWQGTE